METWYRSSEIRPEPDYTIWSIDPYGQIEKLALELKKGNYAPDVFRALPFPKKGALLRPYFCPSIKDQVVFTAYGCLLAPYLEAWMPNFSFGTRWFRRIHLAKDAHQNERRVWKKRPYSLDDSFVYEPYVRAYGLFRRVCHWTATAMLNSASENFSYTSQAVSIEDFPKESLPDFAYRDWWQSFGDIERAYWMQGDLKLAFPSVRLDILEKKLLKLVREPQHSLADPEAAFFCKVENEIRFYPEDIRVELSRLAVRKALVHELMRLLRAIEYFDLPEVDLWIPKHTGSQKIDSYSEGKADGLPTGLAVSGLLMNVYLNGLDWSMGRWLTGSKERHRKSAAFFRYSDDFILLASEPAVLAEGIDVIWEGIAGSSDSNLSHPDFGNKTNLRINWSKIKPEPVAKSIKKYLSDADWEDCQMCSVLSEHENSDGKSFGFSQWWEENKDEIVVTAKDSSSAIIRDSSPNWSELLFGSSISIDDLGQFVTYLVERLSSIGRDNLFDRFGQRAYDRLVDLHELVRYELDDLQVKKDSRLAFAANRLATAWLPDESMPAAGSHLRDIRYSIRKAVNEVPWKYSLWRSVVRAAVRRPPSLSTEGSEWKKENSIAREWLEMMLEQISADKESKGSWLENWPEVISERHCPEHNEGMKRIAFVHQYHLSFLRTSFWNSLSETILELKGLEHNLHGKPADMIPNRFLWSSRRWTFRSFSEKQISPILEWLSKLDRWASKLYPGEDYSSISSWELDSIVKAVLAVQRQADIIEALSSYKNETWSSEFSGKNNVLELKLPIESIPAANFLVLRRILSKFNRLTSSDNAEQHSPWSLLKLGFRDSGIRERLIDIADLPSKRVFPWYLSVVTAFKLDPFISLDSLQSNQIITRYEHKEEDKKASLEVDYFKLRRHFEASKIFSAGKISSSASGNPTVHRLLWGEFWSHVNLRNAVPRPSIAPVIGLPPLVSLRMLLDALKRMRNELREERDPNNSNLLFPYTWVIDKEAEQILSDGRMAQYNGGFLVNSRLDLIGENDSLVSASSDPDDWEVIPHAAYFLPLALHVVTRQCLGYQLWCHILQFFSSVYGSERILDGFIRYGIGSVPFDERWYLRNSVHLPESTWKILDRVRLWFFLKSDWGDDSDIEVVLTLLIEDFEKYVPSDLSIQDFQWERIDVSLDIDREQEIPRAVRSWSSSSAGEDLVVKRPAEGSDELAKSLNVRIAQISATPNWREYMLRFPRLSRDEIQSIMRQVWECFSRDSSGIHTSVRKNYNSLPNGDGIVIFPELSLPTSEIPELQRLVRVTGRSALIGTMLRVLPTALQAIRVEPCKVDFIVNEAIFCNPAFALPDRRFSVLHTFSIRKPIPAHIEVAFVRAMNQRLNTKFQLLPGRRWYRFVHPNWGDFTVAICADLVNPLPWHSFKREILSIFMVAMNPDVDLFDSMTWIRAYENYVNIVSANHGMHGGSFAWTPKHSQGRELARFRGGNIFLIGDIELPVKALLHEQIHGVESAIERKVLYWLGEREPSHKFKSPPPGYDRPH